MGNNATEADDYLKGITKVLEAQLKNATKALDNINKFQEVEKKRVKIGKVEATVSLLKEGRLIVDFGNESMAQQYYDKLHK